MRRALVVTTALLVLGACSGRGGTATSDTAPAFNDSAVMALLRVNFPNTPEAELRADQLEVWRDACSDTSSENEVSLRMLLDSIPKAEAYLEAGCPERLAAL